MTLTAAPAAAWKLIKPATPVAVAKKSMTVTPGIEWNQSEIFKPSQYGEMWTLDGMQLNDITFFGAVPHGKPMVREVDKKKAPLPKFDKTMLLVDIPAMYETTVRAYLGTSLFSIDKSYPAKMGGHDAIHFEFSRSTSDNLARKGEGRATIVDGKLYMIVWDAAKLHYFDKDIAEARRIMDSATFTVPTKKK